MPIGLRKLHPMGTGAPQKIQERINTPPHMEWQRRSPTEGSLGVNYHYPRYRPSSTPETNAWDNERVFRPRRPWSQNNNMWTDHQVYNTDRITNSNQWNRPGSISYENSINQPQRFTYSVPEIDREEDSPQSLYRRSNAWHTCNSIVREYSSSSPTFRREQRQRRRLALIFGNDNYPSPHQLHSCRQDAIDADLKLRRLGFKCTLILDARKRTMLDNEKAFRAEIKEGDCILIFFSGHGMEDKGKNYLVPIDRGYTSVDPVYDYFCLDDMMQRLNEKKDILNIIVLDACRADENNSTFAKSNFHINRQQSAFGRSISGRIKVHDAAEYIIIYSCDPGQVSLANRFGGNSFFTAAFLKYIDQRGKSIEDVLKDVIKELKRSTNGRQRPWIHSCLSEQFSFKPSH